MTATSASDRRDEYKVVRGRRESHWRSSSVIGGGETLGWSQSTADVDLRSRSTEMDSTLGQARVDKWI